MEQVNNTAAIIAALNANKATKKGARLMSSRTYTVTPSGDMTSVLPPQAIAILGIMLTDAGPWNEIELHAMLMEHTEVSAKQTPWQIFTYYRKKLVESGFVTVV